MIESQNIVSAFIAEKSKEEGKLEKYAGQSTDDGLEKLKKWHLKTYGTELDTSGEKTFYLKLSLGNYFGLDTDLRGGKNADQRKANKGHNHTRD